jgi:hypothetical protein
MTKLSDNKGVASIARPRTKPIEDDLNTLGVLGGNPNG